MDERQTLAALGRSLQQAGLLPAEALALPAPPNAVARPWFVSLLQGASGWLAGLFVVAFIATLFGLGTGNGWYLVAAVLFAAAYGLYAVDRESAFFDQLALALSIAAQAAFAIALGNTLHHADALMAAIVALMECAVLLVMPNRFARLLATVCAILAWALAVRWAGWDKGNLLASIAAWCLIWLPVMALVWQLLQREAAWMGSPRRILLRPLLHGCILGLAFATLASQPWGSTLMWQQSDTRWQVLWPLLAEAAALFALLAAFRLRHRGLMGAAIAAALLHLAHFYFLLGTTLLVKSLIMLGLGAFLLAAAHYIGRTTEGQP